MKNQWLELFLKLLPVEEGVASIFIHNPNSQNEFSLIVGGVNAITPIADGLVTAIAAQNAAKTTVKP